MAKDKKKDSKKEGQKQQGQKQQNQHPQQDASTFDPDKFAKNNPQYADIFAQYGVPPDARRRASGGLETEYRFVPGKGWEKYNSATGQMDYSNFNGGDAAPSDNGGATSPSSGSGSTGGGGGADGGAGDGAGTGDGGTHQEPPIGGNQPPTGGGADPGQFPDWIPNSPEWQNPALIAYEGPQGPMQAEGLFNQIFQQATQGNQSAYNNAANRLRERLTSAAQGAQDRLSGQFAGRGFGASGAYQNARQSLDLGERQQYAQGLNELEQNFENARLQGLGLATGAASGLGGLEQFTRNMAQNAWQFRNEQQMQEQLAQNQNALDYYNSQLGAYSKERDRQTEERMGKLRAKVELGQY